MIVGDYTLTDIVDIGGFGKVYRAYETTSFKPVAIKVSLKCGHKLIKEAKLLKYLSGGQGIPEVYDFGKWNHVYYMVLQLLGRNLYKQMLNNEKGFSLSCVIKIAEQVIERLKYIHSKGVIHRDIKPEQLLISIPGDEIFIVDFGLSCKYIRKNVHRPFKSQISTAGSVLFASIHSHLGHQQSRRDDLESFFYTLLFLRNAHLPWEKSIHGLEGSSKWNACCSSKLSHQHILFYDWPEQFSQLFSYIRKLNYDETPNYDYFSNNLKEVRQKMDLSNCFDWPVGKVIKPLSCETLNIEKIQLCNTNSDVKFISADIKETKRNHVRRKTQLPIKNKHLKHGKKITRGKINADIIIKDYLACQKTDKADPPEIVDKRILDLAKSKNMEGLIEDNYVCVVI
ncbi:hypothetical protein SteCoe_14588 [Stentor coeruleus]|uniref:Casein kinase I n=1 Tax=Stentor coeruleus TaxID=5963 RepID=A0A1R2C5U4_9CILI|nr:hypothetical protein SteCoe_14588 [Stentor coeruleus]